MCVVLCVYVSASMSLYVHHIFLWPLGTFFFRTSPAEVVVCVCVCVCECETVCLQPCANTTCQGPHRPSGGICAYEGTLRPSLDAGRTPWSRYTIIIHHC